tara:strand:+ start:33 stop:875 length:843 start_codon:yes stop_codon:yes gene_type:complete
MSLYDLYYSDINKQHMHQLLYGITNNKLDINTFNNVFNSVFEKTNVDNLLDLNKELFQEICVFYDVKKIDEPNRVDEPKTINEPNKVDEPNIVDESKQVVNVYNNKIANISSGNKLEGNRYNYKIRIDKNIKKINKIIIPIEDNEIFINNTFNIVIPELNIDTICFCSDIKSIKNRDYATYIIDTPCIVNDIDTISIIIKGTIYNTNDYSDSIEINKKEDEYIIDKNYNIIVGDILKSSDDNVYKVLDINDDKITLNKSFDTDKLEFINLNLQNIIIYEY